MVIQLGLIGAEGKMGKRIQACIAQDARFSLQWGLGSKGIVLGQKKKVDIILDFSLPEAVEKNIHLALQENTPIVIGVTGLSDRQLLQQASRHIPLFWSPNFSLGIAASVHLCQILSRMLPPSFSSHILETHHQYKKDSPSGSSLALAQAIEQGGKASPSIHSIRAGEIVGEHSVFFFGPEEKITLSHESLSKDVFAKGALEAALFLQSQPPGLYEMKNLITNLLL